MLTEKPQIRLKDLLGMPLKLLTEQKKANVLGQIQTLPTVKFKAQFQKGSKCNVLQAINNQESH